MESVPFPKKPWPTLRLPRLGSPELIVRKRKKKGMTSQKDSKNKKRSRKIEKWRSCRDGLEKENKWELGEGRERGRGGGEEGGGGEKEKKGFQRLRSGSWTLMQEGDYPQWAKLGKTSDQSRGGWRLAAGEETLKKTNTIERHKHRKG